MKIYYVLCYLIIYLYNIIIHYVCYFKHLFHVLTFYYFQLNALLLLLLLQKLLLLL